MTSLSLSRLLPAAFAGAALCSGIAFAQDAKLPTALTVTAYDTGSSGFNMVVAVGKMMKEKHGADLRVLPAGNDIHEVSARHRAMILDLKARAAAGALLSPRVYTSGYVGYRDSTMPGSIDEKVVAYKTAGFDFVKTQSDAYA